MITGRISTAFDRVYYSIGLGASVKKNLDKPGFDRTGLVANKTAPLEVFRSDDGVVYAEYESLYFSLWRSQELTLFSRHSDRLKRPIADFGCGDGSFGSVLFNEVDYGIDYDPEALETAGRRGIYKRLLRDTASIEEGSVQSVFSNSVLEHVIELDNALSEIGRITAEGGVFAFTVPLKKFEEDLERYFGRWFSGLINGISFHRNMFDADRWRLKAEEHGFSVEEITYYQPGWFTYCDFMLRFFSDKGLGLILPGIGKRVFRRYRHNLLDMVRRSVSGAEEGSNIFVIARKTGFTKKYG